MLARRVLAGIVAVTVLIPIVAFAYAQRNAISWMTGHVIIRSAAVNLARTWAGPEKLFWPVFGLAPSASPRTRSPWPARPAFR